MANKENKPIQSYWGDMSDWENIPLPKDALDKEDKDPQLRHYRKQGILEIEEFLRKQADFLIYLDSREGTAESSASTSERDSYL